MCQTAQLDLIALEHRRELLMAHFLHLLALVAMLTRPDVDVPGARATHIRQDLRQRQLAVHRGADDVFKLKAGGFRGCGKGRAGTSGAGGQSFGEIATGKK